MRRGNIGQRTGANDEYVGFQVRQTPRCNGLYSQPLIEMAASNPLLALLLPVTAELIGAGEMVGFLWAAAGQFHDPAMQIGDQRKAGGPVTPARHPDTEHDLATVGKALLMDLL